MRLFAIVNDTQMDDALLIESVSIDKDISDRASTAEVTFTVQGGLGLARYDTATYDNAVYGVDIRELYDIRLEDVSGSRHFAGKVVRIEFERKTEKLTFLKCNCVDYTSILDAVTIPSATFTGQSDRAILQSLITTYAPSLTALTANIAQLETIGLFDVRAETLRNVIDRLCALTGAEWRVDYNANLRYFLPTAYPAPFGLSSAPTFTGATGGMVTWDQATQTWIEAGSATWDDTSSLAVWPTYGIDAFAGYTRDFVRPINSCRVLGGFLAGGIEIDVTYEDPVSILEYGRHSHTIVDREIGIAVDATLRAKSVVREHAYPEESFTLTTLHDGLDVGQSLPVYHGDFQISGAYIIRSIRLKQLTGTITQYELDLGVKPPDELRLLRQLEARSRRSTQIPEALPVAGSVGESSIQGSGLSTSVLIGNISASGNVGINADAIFGTITGVDVTVDAAVVAGVISGVNVVVDAGTIQGVITGTNVAVDVTTFQGAIISSQVADSLIDRLSMFNSALRPIPEAASHPALPNSNYPTNSYYRNTTDGQFYYNAAGVWQLTNEATALNGKVTFFHVGTIKAGSIIGLIAAAQIGSITAGQITGQIQASQIVTVNASAITGSITATQIGSVNMSVLQGTLTASDAGQIEVGSLTGILNASHTASVNVGALDGQLIASQIASVNASSIVGSITATQIGSVNASSISGTITSTQIGSINAATITIGLVGNSQIGSMSASKLTAGTIDASVISVVNLSAASITTGSFSADRITSGTMTIGGITVNFGSGGITLSGFAAFIVGSTSITAVQANIAGPVIATRYQSSGGAGVLSGTINYAKSPSGSGTITVSGGIITAFT